MKVKRIGTALLALCILLGNVLQSAQFSANAAELTFPGADASVTYDFVAGLARSGEDVTVLTDYDSSKNTNWAYHSSKNSGGLYSYYGTLRFNASTLQLTYLAFKIKAPKEGKYVASITHMNHAGAKAAEAYILPMDTANITTALESAEPFGTLTFADGSPNTLGVVEISGDEEYLFVLKTSVPDITAAGAGASGLHITSLVLDGAKPDIAEPTASVVPGLYADAQTVELSTTEANAKIYYTTDGTEPTENSNEYTDKIIVSETTTIKAITVKNGIASDVSTFRYRIYLVPEYAGAENTVTYDFTGISGNGTITGMTDYNATKNTNWAYLSNKNMVAVGTYYGYGLRAACSKDTTDAYVVFKAKAPKAGAYAARFSYAGHAGAKSVAIYILPVNTTDIDAAIAAAKPVGVAEYVSDSERETYSVKLGTVMVDDVQEMLIVFKTNAINTESSAGAGRAGLSIGKLILDGNAPSVFSGLVAQLSGGVTASSMMPGADAQIIVSTPDAPEEAENADIKYVSKNPDVISVDENGKLTAKKSGVCEIQITASLGEQSKTISLNIVSGTLKDRRSIYTDQKVANITENIQRYAWARSIKNGAVSEAAKYVGKEEQLWNMVTTQNLPRSTYVGYKNDPNYGICVFCGGNILNKYGSNPYTADPMNEQWKIKCPDCRRTFPSNDFGSYYKLGIDENGNWQPALSKAKNDALIANGEKGYLVNTLYPERGEGWGVDDGFGWKTGNTYANGVSETKTFIAYYNGVHLWYGTYGYSGCGTLIAAAESLADAYLYTGEARYGRTGAILFDRIADVYPDMDASSSDYKTKYMLYDGGAGRGQVIGRISDYNLALNIAQDYDMLWPAMEDEYVIDFLSEKATQYNMENPKTTAELIRANNDNGILREIYQSILDGQIRSNFGHTQMVMAAAAIALDTMPETKEWIDWIFESDPSHGGDADSYLGGDVYYQITDLVDRDGHGNEAAPGYNIGWINSLVGLADQLAGYDKYAAADLYKHPKIQRMFLTPIDLTMIGKYTPLIGDTGYFAKPMVVGVVNNLVTAWYNGIQNEKVAQMIYLMCNGKLNGLHAGITEKNPEAIQQQVLDVVNNSGTFKLGSQNMTGYGLAILRAGEKTDVADTQRDFWMYYGSNDGHGHEDKLNLGLHAYGIDLAPDFGNPLAKTANAERLQWTKVPMAHNTVMVAEKNGENYNSDTQNTSTISNPLHFDDAGRVKIMDVDAPEVYDSTEIFRRTVVTVDATDDISYAVDFFRVKGGDDHLYNFHAQSNEVTVEGATMVVQNGGSYAGADVPFGPDPITVSSWSSPLKYPAGFTWLENVSRAKNPTSSSISADFKIADFHGVLTNPSDLHLKLTMLNDSELSEFAVADVMPPQHSGAPTRIKQIVARRQGSNLDSLFTTVIQPYKDSAYIDSVEEVDMAVVSGRMNENDVARAVKVTLKSGRIDYIVYATNNGVSYKVDGLFEFSGFVGVYSVENDGGEITPVYAYINDGTKIGTLQAVAAFTGTVEGFTEELSISNEITVSLDENTEASNLIGKYIYVNNDGVQNASYKIEDARIDENGKVVLDIGEISLIRKYKDSFDINGGYVYNIAKGQSFTIPNSVGEELPTITGNGIVTTKSLILDGIVYVNAYVAFDDMTGVDLSKENIEKNAGIKVEMNGETYENVGTKYSGVYGGYTEYTILTNGIPAKSYGDTLTITPFITVDGEKYYGTPSEYSVKQYCMNQINKNRATKDVCIAMLNYGAAAQAQFKHNTSALANADLTDEQKALAWDDAYLTPVVEADSKVVGMFASTGDVNFTASSLALEGAIEVSYYNNATTTNGNERSKVMYFWTADDYNAIAAAGGTLTTENASYSVDVAAAVNEGYGYEYKVNSQGIAAKAYSDTLYAALYVVDADGDAHASGVRAYSPEAYAKRQIERNTSATLVNLVKWITVYGEKAAAYFG